jgi:hypothetical protein
VAVQHFETDLPTTELVSAGLWRLGVGQPPVAGPTVRLGDVVAAVCDFELKCYDVRSIASKAPRDC